MHLKHLDDLKALRIKEGCQGHSSTFNCNWCHGKSPFDRDDYFLRTFKSLRENYKAFQDRCQEVGEKKALLQAKEFKNVVNKPLINGADHQELLVVAPDALSPMPFKVVAKRSNRKLNKFTMS